MKCVKTKKGLFFVNRNGPKMVLTKYAQMIAKFSRQISKIIKSVFILS